MIDFEARFTQEEAGNWSVEFPELEGCVTCGETLEEAEANAKEALSVYLESIYSRDDGQL